MHVKRIHKIFAMFQDEFLQITSLMVVECISNGTMQMYKMRMEDGTREYYVNFNSSNCSISCSCKRFEALGLLCRHAIRLFNLNNVKKILEKYILERWTKDAKQGCVGREAF